VNLSINDQQTISTSKTQAWLSAFRLRTLPLALSCIGMGGFIAASRGKFDGVIFFLCCLTTILLQVLSNLANDYGDFVNGADSAQRKGPSRAVQSGAISPREMKRAIVLFVVLSLCSGIALLLVSFGLNLKALLFFFSLGIFSIIAAIAYTVGRRPYGYLGLGDLSVLIFFGLVGVMGSLYLFTQRVNIDDILPALSCGLFSMAVLNVNNIRDIQADREAGKFSVPVRIGRRAAIKYHWFLLMGGLFSAVAYTIINYQSPWQLLFLITAVLFIANGIAISRLPSEKLDPYLKQLALSTLVFVVLFGLGLLVG
jgi:1,4-dihydroxy-2-naphthoate octaprenyltransferase